MTRLAQRFAEIPQPEGGLFVQNAVIKHFTIRNDGIMTVEMTVDLQDGGSQGFLPVTGDWNAEEQTRVDNYGFTYELINGYLDAAGVSDIKDIEGKAIRVMKEKDEWGFIVGFGHILNDRWYYPELMANTLRRAHSKEVAARVEPVDDGLSSPFSGLRANWED